MRKIVSTILVTLISFSFLNFAYSDEQEINSYLSEKVQRNTELNFFTGMFDFSDDKQRSGLFGLQHQNDVLFRESFLGKLSPITGGFLTGKNAHSEKQWILLLEYDFDFSMI